MNWMTAGEILSRFDQKTIELATQLRKFLFDELDGIIEVPDNSANLIGYGYGAGYKETICTILLSKQGVKLGFYKGSELPDPQKLMTGSGKVHRFVYIKSGKDIHQPGLRKLVKEAWKAYQLRKNKQ